LSVPEPEEEEQKTKCKEKGKRKHQSHVAEEEESPPSKKALVEIEDFMYFKLKIVDLKKIANGGVRGGSHTKTKDKHSCLFLVSCLL
jgi:hypothetical protein